MKTVVSRAKAYLKVRHKSVRDAMKHLDIDGLLLTHPPDLAYLTNFTGDDSIGLITEKGFFLITDFRYQEQAEIEAGWLKTTIRDGKMADSVAAVVADANLKKIGFEANFTTVGQIDALLTAFKQQKDKKAPELVPLENVLTNIRKVKDDTEINLIRKSVNIAEEAFEAIRGAIEVGQSENYLAGLLVFELRSRGASSSSFPVIIASGANSSLPHYLPGETLVQKDQPLLIDWGALYKGYCSDLTRTLIIGRANPKMKEIYNLAYEAQKAAIKFLRPGVTTLQADAVARDIITAGGYGEQFGHGLGHGIGREIHELPTLRRTGGEEELRPGMIVTVEPGIYLPGIGGVRIEDDVLITHSGCEVLSSLDRNFEANHLG
ncbi:MAG: aminopeptidase P family protein [Phycisphaerales bacterium]|jgi:Xaa-Pro aminopeptidase|nr:aminopeptidase P family protein [Phycisphaerales bacterium]